VIYQTTICIFVFDNVHNVDDSDIDVCKNNGNPTNAHKNLLHRCDNLIRDLYAHSTSGSLIRADHELTFLSFRPHHHADRAPSIHLTRCLSSCTPRALAIIANKRDASLAPGHRSIVTPILHRNEKLPMGFSRAGTIQGHFSLTTASATGIHVAASTSRARTQVIRRTSETGREMPRLASPVVVDVAAALGRIVPRPPLCLPVGPRSRGSMKTLTSGSFPRFVCVSRLLRQRERERERERESAAPGSSAIVV